VERRQAGFIDKSGNFVMPPQFQYARGFVSGLAEVELDGSWGYINRSGDRHAT